MTERMEEIKRRWYRDRPDFMPSGTHEADMRDVNYMVDRIAWLEAAVRELESGCKAACGYLLNAKIDLETGAPKRTAISTIEGGLKTVRAALSSPLLAELRAKKSCVNCTHNDGIDCGPDSDDDGSRCDSWGAKEAGR